MASDDWRTSGHAPDIPPGPHGATPEAAAAAAKAARERDAARDAEAAREAEAAAADRAARDTDPSGDSHSDNLPGGEADADRIGADRIGAGATGAAGAAGARRPGFGDRAREFVDRARHGFGPGFSPGAGPDTNPGSGEPRERSGDREAERLRREEFKREARARAEAARIEAQRQASTWWRDFTRAAVFLTRIPMQIAPDNAVRPLGSAVRGFPIVGLVVGVIGALAFLIAEELGLPHLASALIAVAATALIAGGIHEDGLADTVDGFMGARERDRTLEIMHDSRIGAFGAFALTIVLGCKVSAIETLEPAAGAAALVAAEIASRTVLPGVMLWLDPARLDGLGFDAGRPSREDVLLQALLGGVLVLLMIGIGAGIVAIVVSAVVAAVLARIASLKIGGHTGDVLGAIQQVTATAVLLTAAAAM